MIYTILFLMRNYKKYTNDNNLSLKRIFSDFVWFRYYFLALANVTFNLILCKIEVIVGGLTRGFSIFS